MASATSTYSILTGSKSTEGSIRYWCNHALIPAAQCLEEAEAWIYQRLRVRDMVEKTALSLSLADETIDMATVVDGFQQPIRIMLDGYGKLPFVREDDFPDVRDSDGDLPTGTPSCWTVIGTTIYFDTALSAAMAGDIWFYGTPDALSTSNETNFLTDKYPSLLRHACLMRGYSARNRADMVVTEQALAETEVREANMTDEMHRYGQIL